MAEELRIIVVDEGRGTAPSSAPASQGTATNQAGQQSIPRTAPVGPLRERQTGSIPVAPPTKGPPALTPTERDAKRFSAIQAGTTGALVAAQGGIGGIGAAITGGLAKAATALGPLGLAAIAATAGITAMAGVAVAFAKDVKNQIALLKEFSGDLALSTARRDVAIELATIRRADSIGPALARIDERRTRREVALFEIGTEIRVQLLELAESLAPIGELITAGLEQTNEFLKENSNELALGLKFILESPLSPLTAIPLLLGQILEKMGIKPEGEGDGEDPFMAEFLRQGIQRIDAGDVGEGGAQAFGFRGNPNRLGRPAFGV